MSHNFKKLESFFPNIYPFSCLIALVKISSMMLKSSGKRELLALFLIFVGKLKVLTVKYDVRCRCLVGSYPVEEVPFYS